MYEGFNTTQGFREKQFQSLLSGWEDILSGFIEFLRLFAGGCLMCPRFPPSSLVFCLLPGERVLCFHGPLLYEAKVRYRAALTCVC